MEAKELKDKLDEMFKAGAINGTTEVVLGQIGFPAVSSVRAKDIYDRDDQGKTKNITRKIIIT